mmetsp:Transcript_226/g.526  ORF Transcript_226/g.526 Transcript_226/m.526 type:complete len:207 (-) Transcript_226:252-872(-)
MRALLRGCTELHARQEQCVRRPSARQGLAAVLCSGLARSRLPAAPGPARLLPHPPRRAEGVRSGAQVALLPRTLRGGLWEPTLSQHARRLRAGHHPASRASTAAGRAPLQAIFAQLQPLRATDYASAPGADLKQGARTFAARRARVCERVRMGARRRHAGACVRVGAVFLVLACGAALCPLAAGPWPCRGAQCTQRHRPGWRACAH